MFSFSDGVPLSRASSVPAEVSLRGIGRHAQTLLENVAGDALPQIRPDKRKVWQASLALSGLLIALYAWLCFFHPFGATAAKDFSNVFTFLLASLGTLSCLTCTLSRRDAPKVWRCACLIFGVGWAFNAAGESVWVAIETLQGGKLPSPSLADAFFVASYTSMLAGLGTFFWSFCSTRRTLTVLDAALLTGSFGALAWFFVLQPVWLARDDAAPVATYVALFYPLFDILLLWGALSLSYTSSMHGAKRRAALFVACVTTLFACSDLWYAFLDVSGSYSSGGWNDLAIGVSTLR